MVTYIDAKLILCQGQYPAPPQAQQAFLQVEFEKLDKFLSLRNFTMPYEVVLDEGDENSLGGTCFELGIVADLCEIQSSSVEQYVCNVLVDATREVSKVQAAHGTID